MKDLKILGCVLLALLPGYLVQLIGGQKLVINPSGETQNQPAGKGFGLTCQGEADDTEHFSDMKWIGPKGELTTGGSGPEEVSSHGSNILILMFKSPTTDDSGRYNCTASYGNSHQLNAAVNLIFYQDITWEDCPEKQALVINSDGKIRCRVSANPPATVTWTKDNQMLPDRYVTETDGVRVSDVIEDDKGEFSVRAMVPLTGRFQSRMIKVEVHVPPEIIELDVDPQVIEGSEATLHCRASGFPLPLYSWFDKDQRNLSNVEGHIVDQDTGTIIFSSVKKEEHGSYTCMAKNPAGEAKRNLDLTVIVKPEIRDFANQTVVENQDATFECHAYGDPPPEMSIRKDGVDRPFSESDDRVVLNTQRETDKSVLTLTIQRTIRSDDGLYYCTAENKGANVEKVGHLTVEFAPVMSSTPSTSMKTWNGNSVNLTCIAESIPNATITWSYLGQEIRDNNLYTVYGRSAHSNLLVRPPSEAERGGSNVYGVYKCEATNAHGSQYINIELQEARPPTVPELERSPEKTATTVTFFFRAPRDDGGLPIRAFVVQYKEENQPYDQMQMHEWNEGLNYILQNLQPRTAYRIQFAAKNEAGIGEWSDEIRIDMPAESAPEPPKFITPGGHVSTYPDRFQIRWTVPLDNGRKIDYFELRYFEVEKRPDNTWKRVNTDTTVKQVTDWENSPMYELKNLKSNTFYKVEVRAHNDIGYSQDATMVFKTAAGSGMDGDSSGYSGGSGSGLSAGAIAAIIIVLVLVILIVLDVTCYVRYEWGVLFLLRNRVCAKPMVNNKAKEAAVEDGKGGKGDNMDKKSRTEVDNPAFDAKDSKLSDNTEDGKNKSPKGSKSSIAKDSLV